MTSMPAVPTFAEISAVSNSRLLDHIAHAVRQVCAVPPEQMQCEAERYFETHLTEAEKLAFPFFLVRMHDVFATVSAAPAVLFGMRAVRMAQLARPRAA
jgi:hypothetical protein